MKTKYYVKKDRDYDLFSVKAVTFKLRILLSIEILKSIMKQINLKIVRKNCSVSFKNCFSKIVTCLRKHFTCFKISGDIL